jgi:hypothetical protein
MEPMKKGRLSRRRVLALQLANRDRSELAIRKIPDLSDICRENVGTEGLDGPEKDSWDYGKKGGHLLNHYPECGQREKIRKVNSDIRFEQQKSVQ